MNAEQWCKTHNIPLIDVFDLKDFKYLEARGYRFCIEFGYENASDIADTHRKHEREQATTRFLRRDQIGRYGVIS